MAKARRISWIQVPRGLFAITLLAAGCGRGDRQSPVAQPAGSAAQTQDVATTDVAQPVAPPSSPAEDAAKQAPGVHWADASHYKFSIFSDLTMTGPDGSKTMLDTNTVMHYTWHRRGEQADLLFHSLAVEVNQNRVQTMHSEESRGRFRHKQGDDNIDVTYDEANPELQQVLATSRAKPKAAASCPAALKSATAFTV